MKKTELTNVRANIADVLKNRRKELNMSQTALADKTGMGIATIKRFESGRFWLNSKQLVMICHALNFLPDFKEHSKLAE